MAVITRTPIVGSVCVCVCVCVCGGWILGGGEVDPCCLMHGSTNLILVLAVHISSTDIVVEENSQTIRQDHVGATT